MKKLISNLPILVTVLLLSCVTIAHAGEFIGTYGVAASDPSQIKLTINADHTFYYQDFSAPDKKIAVNGNWKMKGKKVILVHSQPQVKFHNVWTFVENGQVAKSRMGFTFYRLCKIND